MIIKNIKSNPIKESKVPEIIEEVKINRKPEEVKNKHDTLFYQQIEKIINELMKYVNDIEPFIKAYNKSLNSGCFLIHQTI